MNATQTAPTEPHTFDDLLEILDGKPLGVSIEDIYRGLSGDTGYEPPEFDPFGDNPVDPKLDTVRELVDDAVKARKVERNGANRYLRVRSPFAPEKPAEPRKAQVPSPRTPREVSQPQGQSQTDVKPVRSEKQTRKGQKHPGSATKNRPTRDVFTQNDHLMAILRMDIPAPTALVAVRLATLYYGSDSYGGRGAFKAPLPTVADMCNMGRSTFSRHLAVLQEAGLFVRLDNAKGGRGHRNPLVLKTSLPAWHGKDEEL